MSLMADYLPRVKDYLNRRDWHDVPVMQGGGFKVEPLAQGEYNLNYRMVSKRGRAELVFRVNIGTQIDRRDQILYEYRALKLLEKSGFTPRPYFVDDSRQLIDRGLLIMEYLPGEPLNYRTDLGSAAGLFAAIHQVEVAEGANHLIREEKPLSMLYEECRNLLQKYFESELAEPAIRSYLQEVIHWADSARRQEAFFEADPWPCIVNTEVNSGNFIVDRRRRSIHLVDWEMPRWGDPSQDLCHFCSPLTTLWKTDYRMTPAIKAEFIDTYSMGIHDRHLRRSLKDRIRLRDPFVYLRGISWSAMGWVAYQTEFAGMKNPDTWQTLLSYMNLEFIRSLFDGFLKR